ncbi:hypothetical protein OAH91_00410 [Emcibacteraceae bacterium]|nr:hypothetical protein [Emcibacteraceae bacterium]
MTYVIAIIFNFFLGISYYFMQNRFGQRMLQLNPINVILAMPLLITIFGVNAYYLFDLDLPFGLNLELKEGIIGRVYIEYYISWITLFLLFGFFGKNFRIDKLKKTLETLPESSSKFLVSFDFFVFLFSMLIIFLDLLLIGSLPGVAALNGDVLLAGELKGEYFERRITAGIPIIGYLMQYFHIFAVAWFANRVLDGKCKAYLSIIIIMIFSYSILALVKSHFILPAVSLLVVISIRRTVIFKFKYILTIIFPLLVLLYILFAISISDNNEDVLEWLIRRLLLAQIEGAFLIRSIFDQPLIEAFLRGAPLVGKFGFQTMDPSAEIVILFFGEGSGWVNMNSHFIGQGFVMVGSIIPVLGPLFIFLNFYIIIGIANKLYIFQQNSMSQILAYSTLVLIPINTNFGLTLYFKPVFAFLILSASLIFLRQVFNSLLSSQGRAQI